MGWFDEQIRQRIQSDDEAFADAFASMADVIMGAKLSRKLNNDRIHTKNAIEEILKYYHIKLQELPDGIDDVNDQLEYLMRPSGVMRRTVSLEGEWYRDAMGAMLATRTDSGTAVALLPKGLSGYAYFDAEEGKWLKITAKNAGLIDVEAICFYKPFPIKKLSILDMQRYILQTLDTSDYVMIAASTFAVILVGMLIPRISNIIYSYVITNSSVRLLLSVFSFLFCVTLSQTLIQVVKELITRRIECKMDFYVRAAAMSRLLSLPAEFFRRYSSGELASRMGYINALCEMLQKSFLSTGLTALFSLTYMIQMFSYGPGLVVPGMVVILSTVFFSCLTVLAQIGISRAIMETTAKESGLSYALINGVQKIRLAGAEKRAFAKWANSYVDVAKAIYNTSPFYKISNVISTCISLVGTIVIYYFTIKTHVSLADYYSFNAAYGMVMGAFISLVSIANTFAQIKPTLEMARPILETVPEIALDKKVLTRISGGVELNNVSFRYSEDVPFILDNLSLKIRPGQYVAVVGQTGCGKSTLVRLLLGFETPVKGAVYYDGKDLTRLDLRSLRRRIGVVMQNDKLFQGDIFSNITISAPWLSMEDAWEAAEMAGIAEDIRSMPMEMHTMISEGSGGISGGQRQRLIIARAIAPKPKLLIFDEATSALDNITQKIVSESLDRLKCTRIVIAHRLSTIRQCDRILVLDRGQIAEDGTYEELIAANGLFAELVARQRFDTES